MNPAVAAMRTRSLVVTTGVAGPPVFEDGPAGVLVEGCAHVPVGGNRDHCSLARPEKHRKPVTPSQSSRRQLGVCGLFAAGQVEDLDVVAPTEGAQTTPPVSGLSPAR
jgi:hypothetical protein